ncbi:MAG: hypothetical protein SF052_15820 [Bacteroidia bacterium]|nr:hypothetical protein [Bacteroidia bacterium]
MEPIIVLDKTRKRVLEDAALAVDLSLKLAVNLIDKQMGRGFSKENPLMVCSIVEALISESSSSFYYEKLSEIASAISGIDASLNTEKKLS